MTHSTEPLTAATTALIVVDVQRGFVNDLSRDVVPQVVHLVQAWREAGAPLLFARFHNPPGSPYERIAGWTRLRSSEEQEFVNELLPHVREDEVLLKSASSVLSSSGAALVAQRGWRDLVFCGIDTDSCVYDSAVDAFHAGYRPWIVTDACASSGGPGYHEAALLLAARNIAPAQLVTSAQILRRLSPEERG